MEKVKSDARVALHFHPDRLDPSLKSVAEALLESGIYKSQFETLLSSGSVSAHPGGARDLWEEKIFGGAYQQDGVVAKLLSDSFSDEIVLGESIRPRQLIERIISSLEQPCKERLSLPHRRVSDHYIEAQVHGPISLKNEVDYLIADPSFKGTTIGEHLLAVCKKFDITLYWHAGFNLPTSEVPVDFSGPTMPSLAKRVAPDGVLNVM